MKSVSVRFICPPPFARIIAASQRVADGSPPPSHLQLFDHISENEITLRNTGKVGFEFKVLTDPLSSPDHLLPGVPLILPVSVSSLLAHDGCGAMVGRTQVQTYKPHARGMWDYVRRSLPL